MTSATFPPPEPSEPPARAGSVAAGPAIAPIPAPPSRLRAAPHAHRWYGGTATGLLVAGAAAALGAQHAVVSGASGEQALLAFTAAAAVFLAGLLLAAHTGLLIWRGPLARTEAAPPAPSAPAVNGMFQRTPGPAALATLQGLPGPTAGSASAGSHVTERLRPRSRLLPVSPRLAMAALGLGIVTFLACGGNHFTAFNVTTWVASVALWLFACWDIAPAGLEARTSGRWQIAAGRVQHAAAQLRRWRPGPALALRVPWTGVALAAILVFGAALLYYRIGDVPKEMTSDHAEKLLDVRDVLDGQHRIFFPRNTGREAMQFYLIALMTPLTGISYLTMKLGTALVAWFTLPFTFLLARLLFGPHVALLSTLVLAGSRWLWQVARVGLRFPFPPAFGAATMYFLLKAIRDRQRNDFLLCGLALGLAQHTYTSLRLAPLAVATCLGIALAADVWRRAPPSRVHRLVIDSVLLFVAAGLVFMPLARYAYDNPEMFLYRGLSRIGSDTLSGPPRNVVHVFFENVKNALLMFNWRGDVVWVNTIPNERLLDPVSGAFFALGAVYALYRLWRFRELPYLYLLTLLFFGLLPSILSLAYPAENPSTVRSGMAIPVVAILVTLPLALLFRQLAAWLGGQRGKVLAGAALAATLAFALRINFLQYFDVYARQHAAASQHTTHVAEVINGFLAMGGRREDVHILPGAYWFDTRLVAIETGDIRWQPLIASVDDARRDDGVPRERLYIIKPDDRASLDALSRWYPNAIQQVFTIPEAGNVPWFVTVRVPPNTTAHLTAP